MGSGGSRMGTRRLTQVMLRALLLWPPASPFSSLRSALASPSSSAHFCASCRSPVHACVSGRACSTAWYTCTHRHCRFRGRFLLVPASSALLSVEGVRLSACGRGSSHRSSLAFCFSGVSVDPPPNFAGSTGLRTSNSGPSSKSLSPRSRAARASSTSLTHVSGSHISRLPSARSASRFFSHFV